MSAKNNSTISQTKHYMRANGCTGRFWRELNPDEKLATVAKAARLAMDAQAARAARAVRPTLTRQAVHRACNRIRDVGYQV